MAARRHGSLLRTAASHLVRALIPALLGALLTAAAPPTLPVDPVRLSEEAVAAAQAGHAGRARSLMRQAGTVALARPDGDRDAPHVLSNWAQFLLGEGRWEAAEAIAGAARSRARDQGDSITERRALRIRLEARRLLGRFDEAEHALRDARLLAATAPGSEAGAAELEAAELDLAELDLAEALLAIDRSRPVEALPPVQRAILRAADLELPELEWRAHLARAEAMSALGRTSEADIELIRCEELADGPRQQAVVHQRRATGEADAVRAESAVDDMLRAAARWVDGASTAEERSVRGRDSREFLETALRVRPGEWPGAADWFRRIHGLEAGAPESDGSGELRVQWFWGSHEVAARWTSVDSPPRWIVCGDAERLGEWILLFRSLLAHPGETADRERVGHWLADALFGGTPAADRTLRLEGDGPLETLPFALLPTPDGPLGLRSAIVCGARPVGAAPGTDAVPAGHARELLILADPSSPAGSGGDAGRPPLPGARAEARAIASRVMETRVLTGEAAMEARVGGTMTPAVLHIAAHSSPDPDDPALFLAPGEGRDGRLTPDEIRRIPRAPQIVVLSGCESLLTDVSGRNSTNSVGDAFLEAGAGTVVGALWNVEDRALGPLMAAFHGHLQDGQRDGQLDGRLDGTRPSEAMRLARVETVGADPLGWAAFVVRGADDPVRLPPPPPAPSRGPEAAVGFLAALAFAGLLVATRRMPSGRTID